MGRGGGGEGTLSGGSTVKPHEIKDKHMEHMQRIQVRLEHGQMQSCTRNTGARGEQAHFSKKMFHSYFSIFYFVGPQKKTFSAFNLHPLRRYSEKVL